MPEGSGSEERRGALVDLLDRPAVDAGTQPEAYRRIMRHEPYLRGWMWERPRWRLLAGESVCRLERLPSQALPDRGLPRLRLPHDYACLCWALWFAETRAADPRRWFVLSELAAEVARASEGGFLLGEREQREALVRALQLLVDLGALVCRDGQAERWAAGQAELDQPAEVLYEFAEDAPRLLASFDPSGLDAPPAAPEAPLLGPTGQEAPPAARAWRALLLGPLLWRRDDPEGFAALCAAAEGFRRDLEVALGWDLELAADYARVWRAAVGHGVAGVLLDLVPEPGDPGVERHVRYIFHPVLLLCGLVRAAVAEGRLAAGPDGTVAVAAGWLEEALLGLWRAHRRSWGSELGDQIGFPELARRVQRQLRQMGFLRGPDPLGRCWLLPVAGVLQGEYAEAPEAEAPAGPPGARPRSLLDEEAPA